MPMLRDPGRRPYPLVKGVIPARMGPPSFKGLIRIGLAGKGDDLRLRRQGGGNEQVERPEWHQAMLEAQTPLVRPKLHIADLAADESLAVAVPRYQFLAAIHDEFVQISVPADRETINGRISDPGIWLRPVPRDAIMARLVVEKIIETTRNHHIQVEIKNFAGKSG